MAPTHSRHLLIWSLPSLALLFGFFLYRRRKGSLRIDPGGIKKIVSESLNTDDKLDIDKEVGVKLDKEVSNPLVHSVSDDEYTVDDLKFLDKYEDVSSQSTNSPEFKVNIGVINLDKTLTQRDKYFGEISELIDISHDTVVGLMVSPVKNCESDIPGISSYEEKVLESDNTLDWLKSKGIESSYSDIKVNGNDSCTDILHVNNKKESVNIESINTISVTEKEIYNTEINNSDCVKDMNNIHNLNENKQDTRYNMSLKNTTEDDNSSIQELNEESGLNINMDQGTSTCESDISDKGENNVTTISASEGNMVDSDLGNAEYMEENNSGREQKLVTLGVDQVQAVDRIERDSANHSPAEVMLASPSISNYSDVHSEVSLNES